MEQEPVAMTHRAVHRDRLFDKGDDLLWATLRPAREEAKRIECSASRRSTVVSNLASRQDESAKLVVNEREHRTTRNVVPRASGG